MNEDEPLWYVVILLGQKLTFKLRNIDVLLGFRWFSLCCTHDSWVQRHVCRETFHFSRNEINLYAWIIYIYYSIIYILYSYWFTVFVMWLLQVTTKKDYKKNKYNCNFHLGSYICFKMFNFVSAPKLHRLGKYVPSPSELHYSGRRHGGIRREVESLFIADTKLVSSIWGKFFDWIMYSHMYTMKHHSNSIEEYYKLRIKSLEHMKFGWALWQDSTCSARLPILLVINFKLLP